MDRILIKGLLENGVHFGHQARRWNPKMKPFVFGKRRGIFIIDLTKTAQKLAEAKEFLKGIAAKNGKILFVGTKKHAKDIILKEAQRAGAFYVIHRWLGGILTNFDNIKSSITKMKEMEEKLFKNTENLKKKEMAALSRKYNKKSKNFAGIKDLDRLPDALVVVDATYEAIAIKEARELGIPVVAIVDTDSDPEVVDYPIPGNDDAIRSIKFIIGQLVDSILEGKAAAEVKAYESDQQEGDSQSAEPEEEAAEAPQSEDAAEEAEQKAEE